MSRHVIVGLGNPGDKYAKTRHNMGFFTVDELTRRHNLSFGRTERKAKVADGLIAGKRVLLVKPQTFMNSSGEAVRALVDFYKLDADPERLIVAYDDIDLALGTLRLRKGGGHGGQNGVRSVIQHLGGPDFARARMGIGRPPGRMDPAAYVLKPFAGDDAILAGQLVDRAADAIETWLREGIELAMTRHNGTVDGGLDTDQ